MRLTALLLLAPLALAACGSPEASRPATVEITDAWCRATPNAARSGGCYITLTAIGADDRLIRVATDRARSVQIHEMSMTDGVMRMGELRGGLPLPDGRPQILAPGGTHIMLMELNGPLVAGETVPLALTFETAPAVGLRAEVRAIGATQNTAAGAGNDADHHGSH